MSEDGWLKTEDRSQMTVVREQSSDDRDQLGSQEAGMRES